MGLLRRRALPAGVLLAFAVYACVGSDPGVTVVNGPDAAGAETGGGGPGGGGDSGQPPTDAGTDTSSGDTGTDADAGPPAATRAFVTSMKYYGDAFPTVAAADNACQLLATGQGLGIGWHAWISNSTSNAKDRIPLDDHPILLVDGLTIVVAQGTDLVIAADAGFDDDGGLYAFLLHPIDMDETKTSQLPGIVWTGTTEKGTVYAGAGGQCTDWTSSATGMTGAAGGNNQVKATWTSDALEPCSNNYPIYCFGP